MSHTNYNSVSTQTKNEKANTTPATPATPAAPATPEPPVATTPAVTPETPATPESVFGMVFDCKNLNIRKNPNTNSQVLFTIPNGAKVEIILESSTAEWYKVLVNDKEGFCMKKFITLPQ